MLARTADNLFWLARYIERADYTARILEATSRLVALPRAYGDTGSEWESALLSTEAHESFVARGGAINESEVIRYLVFDPENSSSVCNCIEKARSNARAVRTALTLETWESINTAWLELKKFERFRKATRADGVELRRFLDYVKKVALDVDGTTQRTMLRNDGFWFMRLGHYLERADNTARILDVKYHVLLPESETVGGPLDYFQWTAILRSVSALTAYHWVYRQSVKPWHVADLLILEGAMPRSLLSSYDNIVSLLDSLSRAYGLQGPAQRHARSVMAKLQNASIREIFQSGLHEFLEDFINDNNTLGDVLSKQYLIA
jgi:uncharacterized alpha-E superfamily protein